jgi:hypothetical protein
MYKCEIVKRFYDLILEFFSNYFFVANDTQCPQVQGCVFSACGPNGILDFVIGGSF